MRGECQVLNEWMKRGTTTLFVERELGEPLKRTDLPEGFGPQDLRWRWTALRLILPTGLFRLKDAQGEWDVFCVTMVKVVDGQQLKAVTPTPLKDIFTPIWAGPSYGQFAIDLAQPSFLDAS